MNIFQKENKLQRGASAAFFLFVLLLMFIRACTPQDGTPTPNNTNANPVRGGTWVDDLSETVHSLIPNGGKETFADMIDQAIYTPLFVGDAAGKIYPALATEVPTVANGDVSSDLKTWTFKIHSNLTWSDGQPLDARDIDFTWKLWNNPKFGAAQSRDINLIKSADVSSDHLKITFHLTTPFAPFVSIWTDGLSAPLPAHHFASMAPDQILKSSDNLDPRVTSGPFLMSESKPGDHFTVVRNPKYYLASQGMPYLDKIIFRIISVQNTHSAVISTNRGGQSLYTVEACKSSTLVTRTAVDFAKNANTNCARWIQNTILNDFQTGSITSSWFLDVTNTQAYESLANYHLVANPYATNFEAMYFNLANPVLKDMTVRKAMAMAIDRNTLIQTARGGEASPLCTDHGSSYVPGYQANAPCPKYDPAAANALLNRAGWVKGPDGVRTKGSQRLEFQYSTVIDNPWREENETILQQNFQDIGVKIDIHNYTAETFFETFLPRAKPDQFDLAEFENMWNYDADDASAFSCAQIPSAANSFVGANYGKYCNPFLDKLFTQEQLAGTPHQRQQIFNQIHQIYLTDFPFVTLYSPADIAIVKNNAHNYLPNSEGASETVNVWQWWCDGGKC